MISPENTMVLLACLLALVGVGYLAEKTRIGRTLSAPLIILFLGFILGNIGVLPQSAPLYSAIYNYGVPLAIPLLLFGANIKEVFSESGPVFKAFVLAVFATLIGALFAGLLIDLGANEGQIIGVLVASYIGGSANFVSTAAAVELTDPSLYSAALTADALGALFYLTLLMMLPALRIVGWVMAKLAPQGGLASMPQQMTAGELSEREAAVAAPNAVDILRVVLLSAVICSIGLAVSHWLPWSGVFIVVITLLALMIANLKPAWVGGQERFSFDVGTLLMYIFFGTIGLSVDVSALAAAAVPMLVFLVILVILHLVIIVTVGARLRLNIAELMVASSACILGPAAAAAIAASRGWHALVTAGMLVGVLGYAIATFIGLTIATFW